MNHVLCQDSDPPQTIGNDGGNVIQDMAAVDDDASNKDSNDELLQEYQQELQALQREAADRSAMIDELLSSASDHDGLMILMHLQAQTNLGIEVLTNKIGTRKTDAHDGEID